MCADCSKPCGQKSLIHWERIGKYDGWKITNTSLRAAQHSWNVPKGIHGAQYRKEFRYVSIIMIGHDWRNFGILPAYIFGDWNDDLKITTNQRKNASTGKLPLDPAQYPSKPKAAKSFKPRKPKSRKEPFSKWSEYDDWIRDYPEE
jgi:hypothetical protein